MEGSKRMFEISLRCDKDLRAAIKEEAKGALITVAKEEFQAAIDEAIRRAGSDKAVEIAITKHVLAITSAQRIQAVIKEVVQGQVLQLVGVEIHRQVTAAVQRAIKRGRRHRTCPEGGRKSQGYGGLTMLKAFLWTATLLLLDVMVFKLRGKRDGSFTYFLFTGIGWCTKLALAGCAIWLVCSIVLWAWEHM